VIRGRYYRQVSNDVDDARDYLADRTDELTARCANLAERAARLRAHQPIATDDIVAAEHAAAEGLAHAITAHLRTAAQHERSALAHERCADLLDQHGSTDRAIHHRQAATVERDAAQWNRDEADRAEREGTALVHPPAAQGAPKVTLTPRPVGRRHESIERPQYRLCDR
jgi:hypothetical protein